MFIRVQHLRECLAPHEHSIKHHYSFKAGLLNDIYSNKYGKTEMDPSKQTHMYIVLEIHVNNHTSHKGLISRI